MQHVALVQAIRMLSIRNSFYYKLSHIVCRSVSLSIYGHLVLINWQAIVSQSNNIHIHCCLPEWLLPPSSHIYVITHLFAHIVRSLNWFFLSVFVLSFCNVHHEGVFHLTFMKLDAIIFIHSSYKRRKAFGMAVHSRVHCIDYHYK